VKRKEIPQRWIDSGRIRFGPGWWALTNGEPRAFVLDRIPAGGSGWNGHASDVCVLHDSREVG
jgi:hypothetical protein